MAPEDMETLDGLKKNIDYYEDTLEVACSLVDTGEQENDGFSLFQSTKGTLVLPLLLSKLLEVIFSSRPQTTFSLSLYCPLGPYPAYILGSMNIGTSLAHALLFLPYSLI